MIIQLGVEMKWFSMVIAIVIWGIGVIVQRAILIDVIENGKTGIKGVWKILF